MVPSCDDPHYSRGQQQTCSCGVKQQGRTIRARLAPPGESRREQQAFHFRLSTSTAGKSFSEGQETRKGLGNCYLAMILSLGVPRHRFLLLCGSKGFTCYHSCPQLSIPTQDQKFLIQSQLSFFFFLSCLLSLNNQASCPHLRGCSILRPTYCPVWL